MHKLWFKTDALISKGQVQHSWLWGPRDQSKGGLTLLEPYAQASHGWRFVTYCDKTRMEVTNPAAPNQNNPYYVKNGLLVKEMVTGQLQLGDNSFQKFGAAQVVVAGDLHPNNQAPTFAVFGDLLNTNHNTDGGMAQTIIDKCKKRSECFDFKYFEGKNF